MCGLGQIRLKDTHPDVTAPGYITGPPASICALNHLGGDERLPPRAWAKARDVVLAHVGELAPALHDRKLETSHRLPRR
jgi:hypothetical protein